MLGPQREWNEHKQQEMYMANTKILRLGPNATYIPLTHIALGETQI